MLQLEALEEVERAFVHVDYTKRDEPEHKVERNLMSHPKDLMLPHQDVAESSGTAAEVAEQAKKAAELHDHLQQSLIKLKRLQRKQWTLTCQMQTGMKMFDRCLNLHSM